MGWLDKILGIEGANQELAATKAKADAALKTGYDTGRADVETGIHRLDSFATGGEAANKRYLDSLGVNGAEAQGGVEKEYLGDPIQNQLMDRITRANTRRFTSMLPGSQGNNSGSATQSLTNSLLDNWRKYQEQLSGAGGQGLTATTQQSNLNKGEGDMAYGYGATQAGNDIGYGNSIAKNKTAGANFIGSMIGTGVQAAGTAQKAGAFSGWGGGSAAGGAEGAGMGLDAAGMLLL